MPIKFSPDFLTTQKFSQSQALMMRNLDAKQNESLELFARYKTVTAQQIGQLFGFAPRTTSSLCKKWVAAGFIVVVDASRKGRKYQLASEYGKALFTPS